MMYLPFICSKVEDPVPICNPAVKHGTENILIAEDDAFYLRLSNKRFGFHIN